MQPLERRAMLPLLLAASLAASACSSDSPTEPPPPPRPPLSISLSIVQGDGQSGVVGTELSLMPTVLARTDAGVTAGVRVSFAIDRGGGNLAGGTTATVVTDADGRAAVRWTLGGEAGVNMLRVFLTDDVSPAPLLFTAMANTPELRVPTMTLTSLSNAGEVGTFLSPPVATIVDGAGRPVSGVTVKFSVAAEHGVLSGVEAVTDVDGRARVGSWRLGTVAGPQTIVASSAGVPDARLTVDALPGAPVELRILAGDAQTGTVMTRVATTPSVKLVDRYGNGIPRVELFFQTGGESGAFVFLPFERTDARGVSNPGGWMLGVKPVAHTLTVTTRTTPAFTVRFTAQAVAGPPAALRIVEGDEQRAPAGSKLPIAPAVQVTDTWGNPVSIAGIEVVFTPQGASGTVTGGEQETNAMGIARVGSWTIGSQVGDLVNRLTAEAAGLRAVSFRASGT